jgi:hypothetical protein
VIVPMLINGLTPQILLNISYIKDILEQRIVDALTLISLTDIHREIVHIWQNWSMPWAPAPFPSSRCYPQSCVTCKPTSDGRAPGVIPNASCGAKSKSTR